jgi:hypothetical protein
MSHQIRVGYLLAGGFLCPNSENVAAFEATREHLNSVIGIYSRQISCAEKANAPSSVFEFLGKKRKEFSIMLQELSPRDVVSVDKAKNAALSEISNFKIT